jgi:hypothetical protein
MSTFDDFDIMSEDAVIEQSPTIKVEKGLSKQFAKFITVQVTLLVVMQGKTGLHYPLGIVGLNFYLLKSLLKVGVKFPNGSQFAAYTSLLYPDKVKSAVREMKFSDQAMAKYPDDELRKTDSWLHTNVMTLFAHQTPEILMETYEMLQSLDGEVLTPPIQENPRSETFKIKVKVNEIIEVPENQVYALKAFVQKTIREGRDKSAEHAGVVSPQITPKKVFEIVGSKRFPAPSSSSSEDNEASGISAQSTPVKKVSSSRK